LREFLAMGGYGAYVWSAYGITALVLVANALAAWRGERRALAELQRRLSGAGADNDPAA